MNVMEVFVFRNTTSREFTSIYAYFNDGILCRKTEKAYDESQGNCTNQN